MRVSQIIRAFETFLGNAFEVINEVQPSPYFLGLEVIGLRGLTQDDKSYITIKRFTLETIHIDNHTNSLENNKFHMNQKILPEKFPYSEI